LDDKKEAQAEGGRWFQREWPITEKDRPMSTAATTRCQPSCYRKVWMEVNVDFHWDSTSL